MFTYDDVIKDDIYKDDQSAKNILDINCQILRVDYQKKISRDKIAAI